MLPAVRVSHDVVADTADHVRIDYKDDRVHKIEEVVFKAIQELVDELAIVNPLFKVSEILKVGGYSEGTKILSPDEFDYIAVLEELSKPGTVTVETAGEEAGIAKLKLNEFHNRDGKWDAFLSNGYVRCFQLDSQTGNDALNRKFENFGIDVIKVIRNKYRGKGRPGIGLLTQIMYSDRRPEYRRSVFELQAACIKRAEVKFPNILLQFIVENREVHADLCPAVRYQNVSECFSPEQCASSALSQSVLNHGSILLVGQLEHKLRITFTEIEVDYIRNRMSPKHKKLYIYLKYLANVVNDNITSLFPSYTLKMVCIWHDHQCKCQDERLLPCLTDVLSLCMYCCTFGCLPSVFNNKLDIIQQSLVFGLLSNVRLRVFQYLREVPKLAANAMFRHQHMEDLNGMFHDAKEQIDLMFPMRNYIETLYCRHDWRCS